MPTENKITIGFVNNRPVELEEGKGRNPSAVTFNGTRCLQGFTHIIHGPEVAKVYADWYAANRKIS